MDKIIRVLITLLGALALFYASKTPEMQELFEKFQKKVDESPAVIEINKQKSFFRDWTEEVVLNEINSAREAKSLSKLQKNEKLNKAAIIRLSLILTADDYEGSRSGVTREISLKNVDYKYKLVGDLVLQDFFKNNSSVKVWSENTVSSETLYHPDFKEVGIALKNDLDRVSVYIILATPAKQVIAKATPATKWGGPDLWEAVNKRRLERGVGSLTRKDELCTIASIRLNQLLELNKLDGHAGFSPVLKRDDLKWISEKYNLSEYLAQGYNTPLETVNAWEGTLGHKSLLQGGEYVWGCVYAQNTFSVAIVGY